MAEKSFLEKVVEKFPYSSAAAGKRKKEIEAQTEEPTPNSYEQYQREKSVGGPNTESYEEWKKL